MSFYFCAVLSESSDDQASGQSTKLDNPSRKSCPCPIQRNDLPIIQVHWVWLGWNKLLQQSRMIDKDEWIHFNKMNIWPWQSDERTVWSMPCFGRILSVSNIDSVWHRGGSPTQEEPVGNGGPWKCHPVSQIQPFGHPKMAQIKPLRWTKNQLNALHFFQ